MTTTRNALHVVGNVQGDDLNGPKASLLATGVNLPHGEPSVYRNRAHETFRRWLSDGYDEQSLDALLATLAAHRLDGEPVWLMIISGSGNAKTETVQAAAGSGAHIISTINSEGALLSATSAKERTKGSTGGLLRELGSDGVLVIKDFTSVLSMDRKEAAKVLAALREVYDGSWTRRVGVDGGMGISWSGRVTIASACTGAWDLHHSAIAAMGDRWVLIRVDSSDHVNRMKTAHQAIANTGSERRMKKELSQAVKDVVDHACPAGITLTEDEAEALMAAADITTRARTSVQYDYRGDVIGSLPPEAPTRFTKQLVQVVRGGVSAGMPRPEAMRLAVRCSRDSIPPLRLQLIDFLAGHPDADTLTIVKALKKPRTSVRKELDALDQLGIVNNNGGEPSKYRGRDITIWEFALAPDIDASAIDPDQFN